MTDILISGLHKTGTTGLYDAVKRAVRDADPAYVHLFEPKGPQQFQALQRYAPERPVLAKVLVHWLAGCEIDEDDFPRRVFTVRDPRDIAVSRLLFRPMHGWTSYRIDPRRLEPFIAALKEKEADPGSHSVFALHELATELGFDGGRWDKVSRQMATQIRIAQEHDFHLLRYEDFVDGRLDDVSAYLDMEIVNPKATDIGWLSHIPRSLGYGEWRHWFLDEDERFFGELFADYMQYFGYDDDWSRHDHQIIHPATSSDYIAGKVARLIDDRQERQASWSVQWVTRPEQVEHLRSMASDGRAGWAHRLALVLERGAVGQDVAGAVRWAREAAILGHRPAVPLLIRLLREHRGDDPAAQGERRFWELEQRRTELEGRLRAENKQLRSELRRRERELARLRGSARYRAVSLLLAVLRSPRRAGASMRTLSRLARRRMRRAWATT